MNIRKRNFIVKRKLRKSFQRKLALDFIGDVLNEYKTKIKYRPPTLGYSDKNSDYTYNFIPNKL